MDTMFFNENFLNWLLFIMYHLICKYSTNSLLSLEIKIFGTIIPRLFVPVFGGVTGQDINPAAAVVHV